LANSNVDGLAVIGFNILLLVIVKKFDPNPILVNINKPKLYKILNVASQILERGQRGLNGNTPSKFGFGIQIQ
jgi:hypothetical protein